MFLHGTTLTVRKFRCLDFQSAGWTEWKYWKVLCKQSSWSNFSADQKFIWHHVRVALKIGQLLIMNSIKTKINTGLFHLSFSSLYSSSLWRTDTILVFKLNKPPPPYPKWAWNATSMRFNRGFIVTYKNEVSRHNLQVFQQIVVQWLTFSCSCADALRYLKICNLPFVQTWSSKRSKDRKYFLRIHSAVTVTRLTA